VHTLYLALASFAEKGVVGRELSNTCTSAIGAQYNPVLQVSPATATDCVSLAGQGALASMCACLLCIDKGNR
jgi:hypothetical protein